MFKLHENGVSDAFGQAIRQGMLQAAALFAVRHWCNDLSCILAVAGLVQPDALLLPTHTASVVLAGFCAWVFRGATNLSWQPSRLEGLHFGLQPRRAVQQAIRCRLQAFRGLANDVRFVGVGFLLPMHTYPPIEGGAGVDCPLVANGWSTAKYYTNDHIALWYVQPPGV